MNVKVAVRMRPPNKRELALGQATSILKFPDATGIIIHDPAGKVDDHHFTFDYAFNSNSATSAGDPNFADQEKVFLEMGQEIITNTFEGFNGCVIAYGQTGAGKSWSMMGMPQDPVNKGLIPRLVEGLFEKRASLPDNQTVGYQCSYIEIYNEKVFDLLDPSGGRHLPLSVRDSKVTGPYVDGLTKNTVDCFESVNHLIEQGNMLRHVASTAMNASSSRSHAMFQIYVTIETVESSERKTKKMAKINLVDLAGSERQKKTEASGSALKEGAAINLSLSTLGNVISELVKEANKAAKHAGKKTAHKAAAPHIPYRDSVLTWLLKENFGGNSKTAMIAALSPAADNYDETMSTLRYANRAKQIVNKAVINESPADKLVRELRDHIAELEAELTTGISNGASHHEIAAIQKTMDDHTDMLRAEETHEDVRLAQTKTLLDDTQAELEANRDALQAILGKEQDVEVQLSTAINQEQKLEEENVMLREKVTALEAKLAAATTDHMTYAADVTPKLAAFEEETAKLKQRIAAEESELQSEEQKAAEEQTRLKQQLADEEAALQAEKDIEQKLTEEMAKCQAEAAEQAEGSVSKEATLTAENAAMQRAMKKLLEKEAAATDTATEAQAKIGKLEAKIAKQRVQLVEAFDKQNSGKNGSASDGGDRPQLPGGGHLIRPSSMRLTSKQTVAEGDSIKAAFQVLSSAKASELEKTVQDLQAALTSAKAKEAEAVKKAAALS